MGFKNLILINPECEYLSSSALNHSVHAQNILREATVLSSLPEGLQGSDISIAVSRRVGQWRKRDFTAESLAKFLIDYKEKEVCLVFGREKTGLTNEEIRECDVICTIPSSSDFPSLNLAHSVMVVLYEIFKAWHIDVKSNIANRDDFNLMLDQIISALSEMEYFKTVPEWRLKNYLKKILLRAKLNEQDVLIINNLFDRIKGIVKRLKNANYKNLTDR